MAVNDWYSTVLDGHPATAYAALPVSPVFASEMFDIGVFANTGGSSLGSYHVLISFNPTKLEFVSHKASPLYQGMRITASRGQLTVQVDGEAADVSDAALNGTSVPIFRLQMRMLGSVPDGTLRNLLTVFTIEMANTASVPFVSAARGFVLDHRQRSGPATVAAEMVVKRPRDAGLFAYISTGVLGNMAALHGRSTAYPLTVVKTREIDTVPFDLEVVTSSATCLPTRESSPISYSLTDCIILLTPEHRHAVTNSTVVVSVGSLTASVVFSVYYPGHIGLSVHDPVLNRILASGADDGDQRALACHEYQRTHVILDVDGFDATSFVDVFQVSDPLIVRFASDKMLQGLTTGRVAISLPFNALVNTTVTVSNEPVVVAALHSRLLTSVVWYASPPVSVAQTYAFKASALMVHSLTVEGAMGRIRARTEWSDGTAQNVPYNTHAGVDGLNVTSIDPQNLLVAFHPEHQSWEATVPHRAVYTVGELFQTDWRCVF